MKFGKLPARYDGRNLKMSAILTEPKKVPAKYDFDDDNPDIPTPMFGNDRHGDCVIAGRAHQTLRFEKVEQKKVINITEREVLDEWYRENGGTEEGLSTLDSLKLWRRDGWIAAKKRYKIKAFAQIDPKNHSEVKATIYADIGAGFGFLLPDSAITQFDAGKKWTVTKDPPNEKNGHYVLFTGNNKSGPVCITWGEKQQMTWKFLDKYCDEAYAIIDAVNTPKKLQYLNERKIDDFLKKLR